MAAFIGIGDIFSIFISNLWDKSVLITYIDLCLDK